MVSRGRKIALYSLSALVVLTIVGLEMTSRPASTDVKPQPGNPTAGTTVVVDQEPLTTARGLSSLPSTADEEQLSAETVRIADHEVDLAYASALREAQEQPPTESSETKDITRQIRALQEQVRADQEQVDHLKKLAGGGSSDSSDTQDKLDVAQAQLTLHQDQLEDARQDLIRAGGDPASRIQQQLTDHEAREHIYDTAPPKASTLPRFFETGGSLLAQFRSWRRLRSSRQQLLEAQQRANSAAQSLSVQHATLSDRATQAADTTSSDVSDHHDTAADRNASHIATMASLRRQSQNSKTLTDYDKRIQDEKQLAELYGQWVKLVNAEVLLAQRAMLRSVLWIVLALLGLVIAEGMIEALYADTTPGRRRSGTARLVLRYITQVIGVLVILMVLLGAPKQLSTILALAGAGLTVALKDFIVAFFGWFVLMGSNGIRVGDWVEINGVGGEVSQIGLLRTILLETGNWNDTGHPTGRKVAFVNSFAIEGHYFNFTTAGQWLWDELDVLIPAGQDPDKVTEGVLKIVTDETRADAAAAEQEWSRITHRSVVQTSSAAPAINLRPTSLGVNLVVRYIVQAHDRYAVRTRLYQKIVGALQGKTVPQASAETGVPTN
jgi:small-conductance mechanosensitive channel